MSKFIYTGAPKSVKQIPKRTNKSKYLIDHCAFVINSSRPTNGIKKLDTPLTAKNNALYLHLEVIKSVCKYPEILIIGGYNSKKLLKSKHREDYILVENPFYDISNSAEDLRISLNAIRTNSVFFIDAHFIPSYPAYKAMLSNQSMSQVLVRKETSIELGVEKTEFNRVHHFSYVTGLKVCGTYYFCPSDSARLKKICLGPSFDKRKFDFEMLETINLFVTNDAGNSLKVIP